MKLHPFFRSEPTKPSQKKGFIAGIMLSWEWEKVFGGLAKWLRSGTSKPHSSDSGVKGGSNK